MSSHSSSNLIRLAPHSEVVTVPVAEYYVVSWKYFWLLVMVSRICWESLEFFRQVAWAKGGQEKWLETHPWFRKGFVWLKCVAVPCLPFDPLFILCNFLCKGKLRAFNRQVSSTDSSFPSALAIYSKRVSFPKKETQSEIQQTKTDQHIYGRKSTTTGCVSVCVWVSPFFNKDILVEFFDWVVKQDPEVPLGLTMIILGASMTPQLQVGLEGWVFHRPDQWFGKGWGSYDIHLPSTEFFTKQIYNQEIHKIHKAEMLKCMVWRSGVI